LETAGAFAGKSAVLALTFADVGMARMWAVRAIESMHVNLPVDAGLWGCLRICD
jgi:hypothetical protein